MHTCAMASGAKTRPTDQDVEAYLTAVRPEKRRTDGIELADIFRKVTGVDPVMWGPSIIGYGSYRTVSGAKSKTIGYWPKTGFSPRKAQFSLYGLKDRPAGADLLPSLGKFTEGAGCVYVKNLEDINIGVLEQLIAIAWARADDPLPA